MHQRPLPAAEADLLDHALVRRSVRLAFPPALERRYEAETRRQRCRHLSLRLAIAVAMFDLFILNDAVMLPDVLALSAALRFVVTGLGIAVLALLRRDPPPFAREGAVAVFVLVAAATLTLMMLLSDAPYREHLSYGQLLVVMYTATVLRLRFPFTLAICAACFALHVVAITELQGVPPQIALHTSGLVLATAIFALLACWSLEREERIIYLQGLAQQRQAEALERLSLADPLTGRGNRRAIDRSLASLASSGGPIGVLIADIDHFKAFNDHHGHLAGDDCIRRVAALIGEAGGNHAELYRFGGEEFLVLLPGADHEQAAGVAEAMRRAVETARIAHGALPAGGVVTASFGVAAGPAERTRQLIDEADAALYRAKRGGRNRIEPGETSPAARPAR
ncbi:GGDEF domain-containing protein [Kaistia geumhonensis]|uniref:diguanylate cyclase n=1 Tax=Kaistia geumhonensis TaxID=410839 RepID=A0ABU0M420_9HYPH|nr:GGDEF domain-containing protein [Kaistia geumhonensis]MCX5479202.1 GGDEF domain-containing protein [Kaistia geumhonensis]MDQ0515578.1 diguanylate cyclase (GGDEF)-like protein [Kaistia geumhonensis]